VGWDISAFDNESWAEKPWTKFERAYPAPTTIYKASQEGKQGKVKSYSDYSSRAERQPS
jgi:hypothetical protein